MSQQASQHKARTRKRTMRKGNQGISFFLASEQRVNCICFLVSFVFVNFFDSRICDIKDDNDDNDDDDDDRNIYLRKEYL